MSVEVLYEDDDIIAVDKPAGVYVHPSPGHEKGALTDELVRLHPEMRAVGSVERPGVVHRLDAETSGVMVFARSPRAYLKMRELFESHSQVRKTYLAVLHGAPKPAAGTLDTTIGRKPWDAKRMAVDVPDGKRAVTHWTVLERRGGLALVEFVIETGRMHQIRVHAAHLGHPVVGDRLYGEPERDRRLAVRPRRQLLHAVQLEFPHPVTGERMCFAAPPPPDIIYAR
jgi:23S rRNA pseudouridine1911/1915/1917 synthase